MTNVKIDDSWFIVDDPVAKRMLETMRELLEAHKEIARLAVLHKKEVLKPIGGSLVNKEDYWLEYSKENNINF